MTRKDIMSTILSDLENNLTLAQGFSVQPVIIKQGVHMWNDFKGKMPALCFTMTEDNPFEDSDYPSVYGSDGARMLNLIFYGYATTDGADNSDTIYDMAEDIESFLQSSNFTYANNTLSAKVEIKEGGLSDPITAFNLEVKIIYD